MNVTRALFRIVEAALDLIVIVAVSVIVTSHRWLDVALWIVAAVSLIGGTWLASRRRGLEQFQMEKPKRPSLGVTVLFVGCFVAVYAGVWSAQHTIGSQWSDNMNCLLGIVVAVPIVGAFALIRRLLYGSPTHD
jgi:hypothetical protein